MARPQTVTLSKKDQKSVLSKFKSVTKNARSIAETLGLPRHQVMAFLEQQRLASYSEGSYL